MYEDAAPPLPTSSSTGAQLSDLKGFGEGIGRCGIKFLLPKRSTFDYCLKVHLREVLRCCLYCGLHSCFFEDMVGMYCHVL